MRLSDTGARVRDPLAAAILKRDVKTVKSILKEQDVSTLVRHFRWLKSDGSTSAGNYLDFAIRSFSLSSHARQDKEREIILTLQNTVDEAVRLGDYNPNTKRGDRLPLPTHHRPFFGVKREEVISTDSVTTAIAFNRLDLARLATKGQQRVAMSGHVVELINGLDKLTDPRFDEKETKEEIEDTLKTLGYPFDKEDIIPYFRTNKLPRLHSLYKLLQKNEASQALGDQLGLALGIAMPEREYKRTGDDLPKDTAEALRQILPELTEETIQALPADVDKKQLIIFAMTACDFVFEGKQAHAAKATLIAADDAISPAPSRPSSPASYASTLFGGRSTSSGSTSGCGVGEAPDSRNDSGYFDSTIRSRH